MGKPKTKRALKDNEAKAVLRMDIVVCTTAKNDDEARALLKAFNFPFRQ